MKLKKLVLYYLYAFILLDTWLGLIFGGSNATSMIHPGIIMRGILTVVLIINFLSDKKTKNNILSICTLILILLLPIYLLLAFIRYPSTYSILVELKHYTKILFMFLLIWYISKNYKYFASRIDKIIMINFWVFIINIYFGYFFNIGYSTYTFLEHSSKGYLGVNITSVYTFVFFAYLLYKYKINIYSTICMLLIIAVPYITGTKAFFFMGLITIFFAIYKYKESRLKTIFILLVFLSSILFIKSSAIVNNIYYNRIGKNYEMSLNKNLRKHGSRFKNPILKILEVITAGPRIYNAILHVEKQFSDGIDAIFLGEGKIGEKYIFGTDACMDPADVLFRRGIIGFVLIYMPIVFILINIIKSKKFDKWSAIVISIFLYGSLGGFVIGTGDGGTIFAIFLGYQYGEYYFKRKQLMLKHEKVR